MNPEEIKAMKKGAEIMKTVAISVAIVILCLAVGVSMSASGKGEDSSSSSSNAAGNAASFWWPIAAGEDGKPLSTAITDGRHFKSSHLGIDINSSGKTDIPIIACYDGIVDTVVNYSGHASSANYGTYVVIKHDYNGETYYTYYPHMVYQSIPSNIKVGETITAGTVVGTMGETGYSFGVHLHFEIRKGSKSPRSSTAVNPLDYVNPDNPYPTKNGGNATPGSGSTDTTQTTTMLVNEWNTIADDSWEPSDLVTVGSSGKKMQREAALACEKLMAAARSDGVSLTVCSAYRSFAEQNAKPWQTNELIAAPNATEHRTGLAVDFNEATNWGKWINAHPSQWKWLCENAKNYGFILRYPLGCKDKTGIHAESWHWRYIGVENAKKFYEVAEQKGKATTPKDQNGNKMSADVNTNDTTTYYLYTYEEFYEEYIK